MSHSHPFGRSMREYVGYFSKKYCSENASQRLAKNPEKFNRMIESVNLFIGELVLRENLDSSLTQD